MHISSMHARLQQRLKQEDFLLKKKEIQAVSISSLYVHLVGLKNRSEDDCSPLSEAVHQSSFSMIFFLGDLR